MYCARHGSRTADATGAAAFGCGASPDKNQNQTLHAARGIVSRSTFRMLANQTEDYSGYL
jgi:hypothetical protein